MAGIAPVTTQLSEAHDLAMLMVGVANTLRLRFDASAAAFDLAPPHARALLAIDELGTPMRELADHLHCDASNVTGIADRLETRQLITREGSPDDRRVKLLVPTAAGRTLREALMAQIVQDAPVMAALDADERATLRTLLSKVMAEDSEEMTCPP